MPGFEQTLREESAQLLTERLRLGMMIGGPLYAAFWLLDLWQAPELAVWFGAARGLFVIIAVATIWVSRTSWGHANALPLSVVVPLVASLGISWMSVELGGFSSDYYIGNMLVLFFVGLFMPWSLRVTLTFGALLTGSYFAMNLAVHGPSHSMSSPLFFLLGASAFSCAAAADAMRRRRRDLLLRLQLEHANEELREAHESKTRFFSNVSHELRTPLMMILGPLDSLIRGEEDDPKPLLETLQVNAHRLLRQVNMLLDLARTEAGRLSCDLQEEDLGSLLHELVKAVEPYAEGRGLRIESEGLDDLPRSWFDPEQIETVAANLLSNAMKFTPEGGVVVVRAGHRDDRVWMEVADTGIGIPEHERSRIFDRFHQVDQARDQKPEGTGLGLALVYELVRLHGGDVQVESEPGRGSRFRVELPKEPRVFPERRKQPRRREDKLIQAYFDTALGRRYEREARAREALFAGLQAHAGSTDGTATGEVLGPQDAPLILIAEDNGDLRSFLVRSLRPEYAVLPTSDGAEALEVIRHRRPELIISDVMMPNVDGHELCSRLRHDPGLATIPVILLTAKAGSDAVVEGLDTGADDYVTKPFDMRELRARIAAHLRLKAAEQHLHERESRLAAIGRMTSAVVHDLRNPLQSIVGITEVALMEHENDEQRSDVYRDLLSVKEAADRAARMTEEIVRYARDGSAPLELRPSSVTKLLQQLRTRDYAVSVRDIKLAVEADGATDAQLDVDPDRLARAIDNLVTNARDALLAGDKEDRRIWVTVHADASNVRISVADNGPGIPSEMRDRLFQPFATAGKASGTGLGLAIVRNVIAAHGGRVDVEDRPGGGTRFVLTLPRRYGSSSAVANAPA